MGILRLSDTNQKALLVSRGPSIPILKMIARVHILPAAESRLGPLGLSHWLVPSTVVEPIANQRPTKSNLGRSWIVR